MASKDKLQKIKDEAIIESLLMSVKKDHLDVFVWKFLADQKLMGHVKIESVRKLRGDFCIVPANGQDRQVQDLLSGQNFIDIYVPDSSLLMRCQIKQTDAPYRYYLTIPDFVAQTNRRSSPRLNVQDTGMVKISFAKAMNSVRPVSQHFLKSCFDVSGGGFSFYINKNEFKFFGAGDKISIVDIKAENWNTKVAVEITTLLEIEPSEENGLTYKVWRVSCRFTQIDQFSMKYLEKFIFERIKDELHAING